MTNQAEKRIQEIENKMEEKDLKKPLEAVKLSALLSMKFPEARWVVEKIVPAEGITIMSGAPASYKTWLMLHMAIEIAKGGKFLEKFNCNQAGVLIIDEENHLRLVQERIKLLGAENNLPIHFLSQNGFMVSKKDMRDEIINICDREQIKTIFIDSLVRVNNAEENDASQMSEVFRDIKSLCQTGKTVILTHHERKEGLIKGSAQHRLRGSSDILAAVDSHLSVKKAKEDKDKIIVEQPKLRYERELETFEISIKQDDQLLRFEYEGAYSDENDKRSLARDTIISVLEDHPDGLLRKELSEKVREVEKVGEKIIRDVINGLIKEEIIEEMPGNKNNKKCRLRQFSAEDLGLF